MSAIFFPDGLAVTFDCLEQPRPKGRTLLPSNKSFSVLERENLESAELIQLFSAWYKQASTRLICGEGGYGTEGFIAVLNDINELQWVAFFDFSNPFVRALVKDGTVLAENNLGEIWMFDAKAPTQIWIQNGR